MASKYLDDAGLAYLWGKIKGWVNSSSANVIHRTGDETLEGVKTFQNTASGHSAGETVTDLIIRNPEVERGTPVEGGRSYTRIILADAEGDTEQTFAGRLGLLEVVSPKENDAVGEELRLRCYKYSGNSVDHGKYAGFRAGYDKNETPFSTAPATSDDRTNSTDIVTRGYMEASEWNWQKTKKAGAVTFKPVPESDLEPVVDFMFTETPPAEGEKGLENPSAIAGVSSVNVLRWGKNINNDTIATYSRYASIDSDGWITGIVPAETDSTPSWQCRFDWQLPTDIDYCAVIEVAELENSGGFLLSTNPSDNVPQLGNGDTVITTTGVHVIPLHYYKTRADGATNLIRPGCRRKTTANQELKVKYRVSVLPVSADEIDPSSWNYEASTGYQTTLNLGSTYYGGSLDVATGVMTVTWKGFALDGTEDDWISFVPFGNYYAAYSASNRAIPKNNYGSGGISSHFMYGTSGNVERFYITNNGDVCLVTEYSDKASLKAWLAAQYANGTPVTVAYEIATPFTVQLTPTQIRSLPAIDKYEPRINTVYSDQEAVQVGYQRFANYVDLTTNQTIDGEKVFRRYIRVKDKSFSVGYCVFPYDTYSSRADVLDSLAAFDNNSKRLFLTRTVDKDSNGNRVTSIYTISASGNLPGSTALTIGLLDVDGASIGYAQAPYTLEYEADGVTPRTNGYDIVTRNWIPKDTRIFHTNATNTVTAFYLAHHSSDNSGICISGGSGNGKGAYFVLFGKNYQYFPGCFGLHANNDSGSNISLVGYPNGTLTWNGQAIQTSSDERVKTPLSEVPDAVLDAWEDVNWGQFQYLDAVKEKGESARLHLGLIAQHVMSVFGKHGLDACVYGILCHEEHPAVDEEETVVDAEAYVDEEGVEHPAITHIETHHEDAVDLWMVRYAEAQAMEACCMRRENARLKKRIADLEERLEALELRLKS